MAESEANKPRSEEPVPEPQAADLSNAAADTPGPPAASTAASAEKAAEAPTTPPAEAPAPTRAAPSAPRPAPIDLPAFAHMESKQAAKGIDLLSDVNLNVKIELGRTRMLVEDVLKLCEGAVVELDKLAGDPVDVYVNDRPIARGEVLVLNDNFCVRITEIIDPSKEQDEKVHPRGA